MKTASTAVIWHDLECGRYRGDLPLWRRLAEAQRGPILEIGAGTGRVALELAGRGHDVTALDRDEDLLSELTRRAELAGIRLSVAAGDARDFRLDHRFGLILVPMQTIQLLDSQGRARCLARIADHLEPGGRVAAAITEEFETYDGRGRDAARLPTPDVAELSGTVYLSQPTAVRPQGDAFILERRRESLDADGNRIVELHRERLYALNTRQLEREGSQAGLREAGQARIPADSDHVGSVVVMLDA